MLGNKIKQHGIVDDKGAVLQIAHVNLGQITLFGRVQNNSIELIAIGNDNMGNIGGNVELACVVGNA